MKLETINKLSAACKAAGLPDPERLVFTSPNVPKRPEMSYPRQGENEETKPRPPAMRACSRPRELSPRQAAAVELLVAGRTACAVARQLGVDRRSVFRWKNDPRFKAAVAERVRSLGRANPPERIHAPAPKRIHAPAPADSSAPTSEERSEMERLFAIAGITPSWKKPALGAGFLKASGFSPSPAVRRGRGSG